MKSNGKSEYTVERGEFEIQIAASHGDIQSLGVHMNYGGVLAGSDEVTELHPWQDPSTTQGALRDHVSSRYLSAGDIRYEPL